jgi:hypothetical protein
MEHITAGIVAGLAGTVAMTMLMMPMMKGQPSATQMFASRFLNKKTPEENKILGMLLHFIYGAAAGLVFAIAVDSLWGVETLSNAALAGYGAVLGVVLFMGMFPWMMILGMTKGMADMPTGAKMGMMGGMLAAHLVYGGVAGFVVALMTG